jgi:acyl-CoA thioester hydrolase
MFGHVNNAVFLSYLEIGRVDYLTRVYGTPWLSQPVVVRRIEIDYREQITLEAETRVETRVSHLGRSSLTFVQRIWHGEREAASAVVVAVAVEGGRAAPLSEEMRAPLVAFDAPEQR